MDLKGIIAELREPLAIIGLIVIAVMSLGKLSDPVPVITGTIGALAGIIVGKKI